MRRIIVLIMLAEIAIAVFDFGSHECQPQYLLCQGPPDWFVAPDDPRYMNLPNHDPLKRHHLSGDQYRYTNLPGSLPPAEAVVVARDTRSLFEILAIVAAEDPVVVEDKKKAGDDYTKDYFSDLMAIGTMIKYPVGLVIAFIVLYWTTKAVSQDIHLDDDDQDDVEQQENSKTSGNDGDEIVLNYSGDECRREATNGGVKGLQWAMGIFYRTNDSLVDDKLYDDNGDNRFLESYASDADSEESYAANEVAELRLPCAADDDVDLERSYASINGDDDQTCSTDDGDRDQRCVDTVLVDDDHSDDDVVARSDPEHACLDGGQPHHNDDMSKHISLSISAASDEKKEIPPPRDDLNSLRPLRWITGLLGGNEDRDNEHQDTKSLRDDDVNDSPMSTASDHVVEEAPSKPGFHPIRWLRKTIGVDQNDDDYDDHIEMVCEEDEVRFSMSQSDTT